MQTRNCQTLNFGFHLQQAVPFSFAFWTFSAVAAAVAKVAALAAAAAATVLLKPVAFFVRHREAPAAVWIAEVA